MPTSQIVYICCSLPFAGLMAYLGGKIKNKKGREAYLIFWSFLCFFFHISTMYVSFFDPNNGISHGFAYDNQLFPIYFCNFIMYLQLVCSVWNDKETRLFKGFATFTAWGGIFGALITVFSTDIGLGPFLANPSLSTWWESWYEFQSALSHTCLLIGSLLMITQKHVKICVYNLIPYSFGLLSCGVVGGLVMLAYYLGGREIPNAMYLLSGPEECPEMHGGFFALAMLAIIFVITSVYEQFTRKKEDRWYKTIKDIDIYLPIEKKLKVQ